MDTNTSDSAVVDGASTSAETTGAAETTAAPATQTSPAKDPWDGFGREEAGADEVKTEEGAAAGETAAATPPKSEEPGTEEAPASEKTGDDEDQVLEELFADGDKPAEADKAAKTEETPKEEDLDNQDPTAMIAGQRNKTAASYLQRMEKWATPLKDLRKGSIEPLEALRRLEPVLGPDALTKLKQAAAHDLVDKLPEQTFKRAYAIKKLAADPTWDPNTGEYPNLDDLVKGVATAAPPTSDVDLSSLTKDIDGLVGWDWRDESLDDNFVDDRERTLARAARQLEAKAKEAEAARLTAETSLTDLKSTVTTQSQTAVQQEVSDSLRTRINEFRGDIQGKFLPYVFKNAGLAVDVNDTPEVAAFKQRRQELYQGTDYERANDLPSRFETFVENESSVKARVEDVYKRIVDAQLKYVVAAKKDDKAEMAAAVAAAEEERVPLFTLLRDAHKEFRQKYIDPEMELFVGKATPRTDPTPPTSRPRPEVVSNGGTARPSPEVRKPFRTADDVWDHMIESAKEDDALSAAG